MESVRAVARAVAVKDGDCPSRSRLAGDSCPCGSWPNKVDLSGRHLERKAEGSWHPTRLQGWGLSLRPWWSSLEVPRSGVSPPLSSWVSAKKISWYRCAVSCCYGYTMASGPEVSIDFTFSALKIPMSTRNECQLFFTRKFSEHYSTYCQNFIQQYR